MAGVNYFFRPVVLMSPVKSTLVGEVIIDNPMPSIEFYRRHGYNYSIS